MFTSIRTRFRQLSALAVALAAFCCINPIATAQTFDVSFGAGGTRTLDLANHDAFEDMTVAPDGSIFVLSGVYSGSNRNIVISKYTSNGDLDVTFGGFGPHLPGTTVKDIWGNDYGCDLEILDDGKILVLCRTETKGMYILRLESNGLNDVTFGDNFSGEKQIDAPFHELPGTISIGNGYHQVGMLVRNNKIVVVTQVGIVGLDMDGGRDMTYGTSGMIRFDAVLGNETSAVAFDNEDSQLVVLCKTWFMEDGVGVMHPRLVAFNENGTLDPTFGDGGHLSEPVSYLTDADAIEVHNGVVTVGGGDILMQLDSTGMLRGNFSMNGVTEVFPKCEISDIQLMTHGRIAVSVKMPPEMGNQFAVARFLADGTLDPTFSHSTFGVPEDGWFNATYGTSATARKLFAYANGKLLVGGDFRTDVQGEGNQDVLLMRLHETNEGTPDGDPNGHGGFGDIKDHNRPTHGSNSNPSQTFRH